MHVISYTRDSDLIYRTANERRKEMFYLTTHSTHFIYGYTYMASNMIKDHSDSEERKPAAAIWAILSD